MDAAAEADPVEASLQSEAEPLLDVPSMLVEQRRSRSFSQLLWIMKPEIGRAPAAIFSAIPFAEAEL
jgi:hypothetical protein